MLTKNMPGARAPRLPRLVDPGNVATVNTIDAHAQSFVSSILADDRNGHEFLTNVPVQYGKFTISFPLDRFSATHLYNGDLHVATNATTRSD